MPDHTQTLSVEPMTREEIEGLLAHSEGSPDKPDCDSGFCATCSGRDKLRAALSQPEHQAAELLERFKDVPSVDPKAFREDVRGEVEGLRERLLSDEAIKAARAAETRWHQADTPDTEAISLVEYVLCAALAAAVAPPSDPQGEQGRCRRCGGSEEETVQTIALDEKEEAEKALEELAEEFEHRVRDDIEAGQLAHERERTYKRAASLAREKAAELKD